MKRFASLGLAALLAAAPLAGHAETPMADAPAMHGASDSPGADMAPHWTYSGDTGPDHWGDLSAEWATCGLGRSQSPVDIAISERAEMNALHPRYQVTPLNLTNNGHTVQLNYAEGSSLTVGGKTWQLKQLHFHTPSEHRVGGDGYAAEIHLVHTNGRGELAVVGVLVELGAANPAIAEMMVHAPMHAGQARQVDGVMVNARDLMPYDLAYYRYMGSLTTPPCSEGVNWYVLKESIEMSGEQIAALNRIMGDNARPTQPRNHRLILDAVSTR